MSDDNEVVGEDIETFSAEENAAREAMRSEAPAKAEAPERREEPREPDEPAPKPAEAPERAKDPIHQAMDAERNKRKAIAEELAKEREARIRLEERTNMILRDMTAARQPAKPEAPKMPDPEQEPFEAIKHLLGKVGELENAKNGYEKAEAEKVQRETFVNQVVSLTDQAERQARTVVPDYDDAVAHYKQVRANTLAAWGASQAQITAQINKEMLETAATALQRKQNPAEIMYRMALAAHYQRKGARAAKEEAKAPPPAADPAHLARVEAGQAANKTLNNAGGKAGGAEIDAKALAAMSEEDFTEFRAKNPKAFNRLMGRAA
jgi:hypothetical protein